MTNSNAPVSPQPHSSLARHALPLQPGRKSTSEQGIVHQGQAQSHERELVDIKTVANGNNPPSFG